MTEMKPRTVGRRWDRRRHPTARRTPPSDQTPRTWGGGVLFDDPFTAFQASVIYEDGVYEEGVYE